MSNFSPTECKIRDIITHSSDDPANVPSSISQPTRVVPRQPETDDQLIALWLHNRSKHTQRAYRADAYRFLDFVGKPLHDVTLGDIQDFADSLADDDLQPSSRNRVLSAVKSLFAFGHRLGYLQFDVAKPLQLLGFRDRIADRILDESQVHRMIALEADPRNRVILLTLYATGVRVAELSGLRWHHLQARDDAGQISVFGKGDKTRTILLPRSVWDALQSLRPDAANDDDPIFVSRKQRGGLQPTQITRIVKRAAAKAGIDKAVTSHWLRHGHASHALDRGAPISLVQATLGHSSVATTGRYLHARPSDSSSKYLAI